MKKRILNIILIIVVAMSYKVNAANYELRELIPKNIKTTIVTNNFSYKNFSFDGEKITFEGIKNLTEEEIPISISIGLFNSKKKNIGTINYCKDKLDSKEEKEVNIVVEENNLGEENNKEDISYIAILGDNNKCRTTGRDDYLGETVEEIGMAKNNTLDSYTKFFIKILTIIVVILVILFLYKFLFTRSYQNFDGEDIRQGYKRVNKELKEQREEELRKNPPKPKEKKKEKSEKVLHQEEQAANEDKTGTDLHNLYK